MSQGIYTIGDPNVNENGYALDSDAGGNSYIGGMSGNKGLVLKVDPLGNVVWSKSINLALNSSTEFQVSHVEVVADTVFGCGWIGAGGTTIGSVLFKINKSTGFIYWVRHEKNSDIVFSNLKYHTGQLIVIGQRRTTVFLYDVKLMCFSSIDGSEIWENSLFGLTFPTFSNDYIDDVMSMTEIQNGKFFVTGRSYLNGSGNNMRVTLFGFDTTGTILLNKFILHSEAEPGINRFYGMDIDYDGPDSLVIAFYGEENCSGACSSYLVGIAKLDTAGTVSFSKTYDVQGSAREFVKFLNVTPTSYVLMGGTNYLAVNSNLLALKTDKNGNFLKANIISKTGSTLNTNVGNLYVGGHSSYQSGIHRFTGSEYTTNSSQRDILLVSLDDNINIASTCFSSDTTATVVTGIIPPFSGDLTLLPKVNNIVMDSVYTDINLNFSQTNCDSSDLSFTEVVYGCDSVVVTVSSISNISYDYNWSNGDTTNATTFYVDGSRVLTVYDPAKCCSMTDTIVVSNSNLQASVELPSDTSICLSLGNQFTIMPISFCNGCQYVWNDLSIDTTLAVDSTGIYSVTTTNACGQTATDSILLEINYNATLAPLSDTTICSSAFPISFSAIVTSADSVLWSNGSDSLTTSFAGPGVYSLDVFNVCNTLQDTFTIAQVEEPLVILPADTSICITVGNLFTIVPLNICGDCQYSWNDLSTDSTLSVDSTGWYSLTTTNTCGQLAIDSIFLEVNNSPTIQPIGDTTVCANAYPISFLAVVTNADSVLWSNGSSAFTTDYNTAGLFQVEVFSVCGILQEDFNIIESPSPSIQVLTDIDTCLNLGQILNIPITTSNSADLLVNGLTNTQNIVSTAVDSAFTLIANNACSSDTVEFSVSISQFVEYTIPSDIDTCLALGTQLPLTVTSSNGNITWFDGFVGDSKVITQPGAYEVTISNACNSNVESINVSYSKLDGLQFNFLTDLDTCIGDAENIDILTPNNNTGAIWDLSGTSILSISESGLYYAKMPNDCGFYYDSMAVIISTKTDLAVNSIINVCDNETKVKDLPIETNNPYEVFFEGELLGKEDYVDQSGEYSVIAEGECGTSEKYFTVKNDVEFTFYAPNAFTPGGGNFNTIYQVDGINYEIVDVIIFNRWGEILYHQLGAFTGWDGTYGGVQCQQGVYVAKIRYRGCTEEIITEFVNITLLR